MISQQDMAALREIAGHDQVSTRESDLDEHSIDESCFDAHQPDVVIWPETVEQISRILSYANEHSIPVVAWSGGSSLEGNPIPVFGGIILAMYRWNKVVEIREDDMQVVVQPGIVYDDLNKQLLKLGLFFPPAPGSADVATIGGMVANNSSGMRAIKYGVTRHYVLKLQVVMANGQIITVGSNAKKSTSGYDLLSLFVGSEGTLGIVTEVTLRIMGLPEQVSSAVAVFDDLGSASSAICEAIRYGLEPSAIELLDANTVAVTNQQQNLSLAELPTVFAEFHGTEGSVEEQVEYLQELCEENGCKDFAVATTPETRDKLWKARSDARESIKASNPGGTLISGDVCVPMSRFGDMVQFIRELSERIGFPIYTFGHAGDGNLHTEMIVPKGDRSLFEQCLALADEIVEHAIAVGGTIAGEHGIGIGKSHLMRQEHGPALDLMQGIKTLLDPNNIMNPGKIFPAEA